jgi:succinate dehydrogenase / fumarate reductase membrane anchor subunit
MKMIQPTSGPKSGENFWLWFLKIVTGLFIILLLLIHFVVNHFVAEGGLLTYADVVAYYRIPIVPIMEIAFLIFVVSHALIGLRSIILDLRPSRPALTAINWLFTLIGIASVIYGVWLIQVIVSRGSA